MLRSVSTALMAMLVPGTLLADITYSGQGRDTGVFPDDGLPPDCTVHGDAPGCGGAASPSVQIGMIAAEDIGTNFEMFYDFRPTDRQNQPDCGYGLDVGADSVVYAAHGICRVPVVGLLEWSRPRNSDAGSDAAVSEFRGWIDTKQ